MSPEAWTELTALGLLLWGIAATVLLAIQLLAWPDDRQKWAATIAVAVTGMVVWRIFCVYKFKWMLGGTEQGIVVFFTAALSWGWMAYASWDLNRGRYGRRWREIRARLRWNRR